MERRLPQRFEHLPHGLLNNPIDHVRNPQSALPAPCLGNVRPADHARPIHALQQVGLQPGQNDRPPLKQRLDRLPIRTRGALVRRHLQQRVRQSLGNLLHRRRRCLPGIADRLRRSRPDRPKPVPGLPAGSPFRVFCCCDRQAELHRRFFDRDRLPLPTGTRPGALSRHYTRLPVLRDPPTSAGPSAVVLSSFDLPANLAGTQQISLGETLRFRRDHVATTPSDPATGIGHRRRRPARPSEERLTALHFRSPPRRIYGLLQTRPHGNPAAHDQAALGSPGQFRPAPLPLRCWIPPIRTPGQDFHPRSQRPCQAHPRSPLGPRCAANPRALPPNAVPSQRYRDPSGRCPTLTRSTQNVSTERGGGPHRPARAPARRPRGTPPTSPPATAAACAACRSPSFRPPGPGPGQPPRIGVKNDPTSITKSDANQTRTGANDDKTNKSTRLRTSSARPCNTSTVTRASPTPLHSKHHRAQDDEGYALPQNCSAVRASTVMRMPRALCSRLRSQERALFATLDGPARRSLTRGEVAGAGGDRVRDELPLDAALGASAGHGAPEAGDLQAGPPRSEH